ncbi:MAG: acyl-[acyl-carrier-protein] thioesterase [Bacteroidaceae bacterium]|nr:acyl-[acyl-carrier-protein] thioesterase [Bacteroidaceae bacterium]
MDTYTFRVEPFSEDVTGRLAWGVLGNTLLRVAEYSAITHGFGFDTVHKDNCAWVLSRLLIDAKEMPRTGQEYVIRTWVARIYRQFTDRLFTISLADGTPVGHAASVWALINLATRQPVNLETIDNPGFHAAMDTATVSDTTFTRCRIAATTPARTIDIVPSDLDINGHVNSIRYLQMATDTVYNIYREHLDPRRHRPVRVEMTYMAETFYGDTLRAFVQPQEQQPDAFALSLVRGDGTPATRAFIHFA